MLFTISGKHVSITDAIRDHAEDETSKEKVEASQPEEVNSDKDQ